MLRRCLLPMAMVVAFLAPAAAPAATVQDVVDQVSQDQYTHYLSDDNFLYTHLGDSRGVAVSGFSPYPLPYTSHHDDARTNIFNTFNSFGLNTVIDSGVYNSPLGSYGDCAYANVVATLPGTVHPDQVYIVSGHYDSRVIGVPGSGPCPGADDDASGVAGVLEAARVLSQYRFDATIKFIAFDREENAASGSGGYVATHSTENVLGMLSLDLIAFNFMDPAHHDKAWVYYKVNGSAASQAVCQDVANAVATYGGIPATVAQMNASDHVWFDSKGSAFLIEHAMESGHFNNNPHFHKVTDAVESTYTYNSQTYNYIDYAFATDMTRGAVGYLATKALLVPEPAAIVMLILGAFAYAAFRMTHAR